MVSVLIGLGGNVNAPCTAMRRALEALGSGGIVVRVSSVWHTRAVGPEQPDFFNTAAVLRWCGDLRALLRECQRLEALAGRDRSQEPRWGPRPLDIDLLLAEDVACRGPLLTLPHAAFHERRFALEPAAEVAPGWVHPLLGLTVVELAERQRSAEPDAVLAVEHLGA